MERIKTLAINANPNDEYYNLFRTAGTLNTENIENEIACYDLDQTMNIEHLDRRFPPLSRDQLDLREIPLTFSDIINQFNPSIIIAGQTKLAENAVISIRPQKRFVVRYSSFYKIKSSGYAYKIQNREILRGEQFKVNIDNAGYSLDFPKDSELILEFLRYSPVIEAISRKNKKSLKHAVTNFNQETKIEIVLTDFFEKLWAS